MQINRTELGTLIRFILFHPDYTVGFGISPNLLTLKGQSETIL